MQTVKPPENPNRAVYAPYQPTGPTILLVGAATAIQILCLIGGLAVSIQGLFSQQYAIPFWWPFVLVAVAFFGYLRGFGAALTRGYDNFYVLMSELLAVFVLAQVPLFLSGPGGITNSNIVNGIALSIGWLLGRLWVKDIYMLYVQPSEASVLQGGLISEQVSKADFFYDHTQAYTQIKDRWLRLGLVLVIATLVYKTGSGKDVATQIQAVIGFLGMGLLVVLWARLRYLRTSWMVERLKEPGNLMSRWVGYSLLLFLAALIPAILLPNNSNFDLLGLLRNLFNSPPPPSQIPPTRPPIPTPNGPYVPPTPPPASQTPPPPEPFRVPEWVFYAFLVVMAVLILIAMVYFLVKAGVFGRSWRRFSVLGMWRDFTSWVRSLFAKREKDPDEEENPDEEVGGKIKGGGLLSLFRRPQVPTEARDQVRYYYQYMSLRAGKAGYKRAINQTPAEYARELQPQVEQPDNLAPNLYELTQLYHEARFSPHDIAPSQATAAKDNADRLSDRFKSIKRGGNKESDKKR